jgi:hypothetical protein
MQGLSFEFYLDVMFLADSGMCFLWLVGIILALPFLNFQMMV